MRRYKTKNNLWFYLSVLNLQNCCIPFKISSVRNACFLVGIQERQINYTRNTDWWKRNEQRKKQSKKRASVKRSIVIFKLMSRSGLEEPALLVTVVLICCIQLILLPFYLKISPTCSGNCVFVQRTSWCFCFITFLLGCDNY